MENSLKMEIYSNNIQYFDNNSRRIIIIRDHQNITIQNKGFFFFNYKFVFLKILSTNNLGKLKLKEMIKENLYLTDFSLGQYNLENFRAKNLGIKQEEQIKEIKYL